MAKPAIASRYASRTWRYYTVCVAIVRYRWSLIALCLCELGWLAPLPRWQPRETVACCSINHKPKPTHNRPTGTDPQKFGQTKLKLGPEAKYFWVRCPVRSRRAGASNQGLLWREAEGGSGESHRESAQSARVCRGCCGSAVRLLVEAVHKVQSHHLGKSVPHNPRGCSVGACIGVQIGAWHGNAGDAAIRGVPGLPAFMRSEAAE